MELEESALFEKDEQIIERLLEQMGFEGGFATLQHQGFFHVNGEQPLILHEALNFDTPSGHIEIASNRAEKMGLPRIPHAGVDAAPAAGYYRLLSPGSKWRLNDEYANDPKIDKRAGPAELILCAQDATDLGVTDGGKVSVATANGAITLTAQIDELVQPGTVVSYKGRWPGREAGGKNINSIHVGEKCDMAGGTSVHGLRVKIRPL